MVVDYDLLDDDPTELFTAGGGGHRDRLGQPEDPRAVGIERADPVVVGQRGERGPDRIPLGEVGGVAEVAPAVLLLQL
jgi:hypothetical protein